MRLREEKGYTYGAHAGFDLRRHAGPFGARAAVKTEVTVPADGGHRSPRSTGSARRTSTDAELRAAQDYLIGVFPLRFETPGPVVGALAGLAVQEPARRRARALPAGDRGGDRRRTSGGRPWSTSTSTGSAIVLVGDADAIGADVEAAGFGGRSRSCGSLLPADRACAGARDPLKPSAPPMSLTW